MKPVETIKSILKNRLFLAAVSVIAVLLLAFAITGAFLGRKPANVSGDSGVANLGLLEMMPIPGIPAGTGGLTWSRERKMKYSDQDVLDKWTKSSDTGGWLLEAETLAEIRALLESAP